MRLSTRKIPGPRSSLADLTGEEICEHLTEHEDEEETEDDQMSGFLSAATRKR